MTPQDVYSLHPDEYNALFKYRDQQVRAQNRAARKRR